MLVLEKSPPPPYTSSVPGLNSNNSASHRRRRPNLNALPHHVLLHIIYATIDSAHASDERPLIMSWLVESLRIVSRNLWIACMHVLRSAYLPVYIRHVTPPYSSDPFPSSDIEGEPPHDLGALAPLKPSHRETAILDLFILIKVKEDEKTMESELYLDSHDEQYRDIFGLMQPRARTEDLVHEYALRAGLVSSRTHLIPSTSFSSLSIQWSHRSVSLARTILVGHGSRFEGRSGRKVEILAETPRDARTDLESIARRLVRGWRERDRQR